MLFYVASGDLRIFKDANKIDQSLMIGDGLLFVSLIAGMLGLVTGLAAKIYLSALFWHLFSACLMFVIVFAPIWQAEDDTNSEG